MNSAYSAPVFGLGYIAAYIIFAIISKWRLKFGHYMQITCAMVRFCHLEPTLECSLLDMLTIN
jgi:hypothetical protein